MHKYTGYMRYTTNNSGRLGQDAYVDLVVSFSPVEFAVTVEDTNARSTHGLRNRRFNFQCRDSPVDLLARDKWRSRWFDRFAGPMYLNYPMVNGVPRELAVTLICSWDSAFAVVEFRLTDSYYQLSRRPPRGVNSWTRRRFTRDSSAPGDDSPNDDFPPNEPATGSTDVVEETPTPVLASPPF